MNETIVAWIALIFSVVVSIISAVFSLSTHIMSLKRQRRTATLEAYNRLQEQALDPLYINYTRAQVIKLLENHRSPEYREEYKTLGTYIARIEHFCVGVTKEIYDKDTVYHLAEGFFDGTIRERIEPIIDRKDSHFQGKHYENTREVFRELKKRREKENCHG